jgi:hypothetical protein
MDVVFGGRNLLIKPADERNKRGAFMLPHGAFSSRFFFFLK